MSEVHTLNAFTIPVFALKYSKCQELKSNTIEHFKLLEEKDQNRYPYDYGYTSYASTSNILSTEQLCPLEKFISVAVQEVHEKLNLPLSGPLRLINSWVSINRKHCTHERHNHLPSTWSGVYYVQADNNDGNITFFNEHMKSNWPYCSTDLNNPLTRPIFTVQPETGLLLIFPSYLEHQVHENKTDNERISISFNYNI